MKVRRETFCTLIRNLVYCATFMNAPVAQLDRVSGFEPGGREFESLRARHLTETVRVG